MSDTTSRGIQYPTSGDIIRTGVAGEAKLAQDLQVLAATTNTAINEAVDDAKWDKGTLLTSATNLSTLGPGIHQLRSSQVGRDLGLPITDMSAIEVVELGNTALLKQYGHKNGDRTQSWSAWRNSSGTLGEWQPDAGARLKEVRDGSFVLSEQTYPDAYILRATAEIDGAPIQGVNAIFRVEWLTYNGTGIMQTWETAQGDYAVYRRRSITSGNTWTSWELIAGTAIGEDDDQAWSRTDTVYCWGDSAVGGGGGGETWGPDDPWPQQLGLILDNEVINRGIGGYTANDVLIRAGIMRIYAVPVGGVIPASGSVQVDMLGQEFSTRQDYALSCQWAGIWGHLTGHDDGTWTFDRSGTGSATPVTQPTLISSGFSLNKTGTHIFMMAGNDWSPEHGPEPDAGTKEDHVIAAYLRAIEAIHLQGERHVLIAGVKSRQDTTIDSDNHKWVQEINNRLREAAPQHFVSRQDWLVENGLRVLGLSPTQEDEDLMEAGIIPYRVFGDVTHIKRDVMPHEASELWAPALTKRGWAVPTT